MNVIAELNDKYGNAVFRLFTSRAECREGQYRMHRHTQYEIGLIERGCGFYDTEHGREEISSGDIFLFSANEYHCITDIFPCGGKRDMQILNLQFLPGFILQDNGNQGESFMRVFTDRKADFCNKLDEINKYTGENQKYMLNAYRVLLTRARQGIVICVPKGNDRLNSEGFWEDSTRLPEYYNGTYTYFRSLGIKEL